MPLARGAMYAQGVNIHVAVWPGSRRNTEDITRFIAKESRSYVVSVSSLLTLDLLPDNTPFRKEIIDSLQCLEVDGGSCVAAPYGSWTIPPVINKEGIITFEAEQSTIYKERQNFDPSGHYSRPDITKLIVNKERQKIIED